MPSDGGRRRSRWIRQFLNLQKMASDRGGGVDWAKVGCQPERKMEPWTAQFFTQHRKPFWGFFFEDRGGGTPPPRPGGGRSWGNSGVKKGNFGAKDSQKNGLQWGSHKALEVPPWGAGVWRTHYPRVQRLKNNWPQCGRTSKKIKNYYKYNL